MNLKKLTYSQQMRRKIKTIEGLLLIALVLIVPATEFGGWFWLTILWIWLLIIGIAVHNLIIYTEIMQENEKAEPEVMNRSIRGKETLSSLNQPRFCCSALVPFGYFDYAHHRFASFDMLRTKHDKR